jgi:hypothetical protein
MSMPSIEDEVWQYWTNEVEANCPTPSDKYRMAYKVLDYKCFKLMRMRASRDTTCSDFDRLILRKQICLT